MSSEDSYIEAGKIIEAVAREMPSGDYERNKQNRIELLRQSAALPLFWYMIGEHLSVETVSRVPGQGTNRLTLELMGWGQQEELPKYAPVRAYIVDSTLPLFARGSQILIHGASLEGQMVPNEAGLLRQGCSLNASPVVFKDFSRSQYRDVAAGSELGFLLEKGAIEYNPKGGNFIEPYISHELLETPEVLRVYTLGLGAAQPVEQGWLNPKFFDNLRE